MDPARPTDSRLPVGYLDQDGGALSADLKNLLSTSTVIRLDETAGRSEADLEALVGSGKLAAGIVVPAGYSQSVRCWQPPETGLLCRPIPCLHIHGRV